MYELKLDYVRVW